MAGFRDFLGLYPGRKKWWLVRWGVLEGVVGALAASVLLFLFWWQQVRFPWYGEFFKLSTEAAVPVIVYFFVALAPVAIYAALPAFFLLIIWRRFPVAQRPGIWMANFFHIVSAITTFYLAFFIFWIVLSSFQ